jgi:tryptophan-rich sensory protein
MAAIFGFNQAAAVAGWTAFALVPISRHNTEEAQKWYLQRKEELSLWWAPGVMFFPIFWAMMYAILVVDIFYFTQVVAADTWQFITGVVMFITHVILLKLWEVIFWERKSPGGALLTFLFIYGTIITFLVCCIVGQGGLYLVPTLLTASYMLVLMFPMILNFVIAFPKGLSFSFAMGRRHYRKSRWSTMNEPLVPNGSK